MARYGRYRNSASADRFPNYREIDARFDSAGTCGHAISKGDRIGYHPRLKKTQCAACWSRWCAEVDAEYAAERSYYDVCGGY